MFSRKKSRGPKMVARLSVIWTDARGSMTRCHSATRIIADRNLRDDGSRRHIDAVGAKTDSSGRGNDITSEWIERAACARDIHVVRRAVRRIHRGEIHAYREQVERRIIGIDVVVAGANWRDAVDRIDGIEREDDRRERRRGWRGRKHHRSRRGRLIFVAVATTAAAISATVHRAFAGAGNWIGGTLAGERVAGQNGGENYETGES